MKRAWIVGLWVMAATCFAQAGEKDFFSWDELKHQLIEQTKVTIFKSAGAATFLDFSTGRSNALRVGLLSHVLTNRFVTGDLGWSGGFDGHVDGVLVGGPGIKINQAFEHFFPLSAEAFGLVIPERLKKFYVGANLGWGVERGEAHYGIHFGYEF